LLDRCRLRQRVICVRRETSPWAFILKMKETLKMQLCELLDGCAAGGSSSSTPHLFREPRRPDDTVLPIPVRPQPVRVRGIDDHVEVKLASDRDEWEEAFRLVADNYKARGYESTSSSGLRFTPFHALPDTAVFVAKREGKVVATVSQVCDTRLLGLPMECIFGEEIAQLRAKELRLAEVTCLADRELPLRQFLPVFAALTGLTMQWGIQEGADLWLISVNPRHRAFYRKMMGFLPLGPSRSHPSVLGHPAEAYMVSTSLLKVNAPDMHARMLGEAVPREALQRRRLPSQLIREFASSSTVTDLQTIEAILAPEDRAACHRRWR
jgi:hypothetical protein